MMSNSVQPSSRLGGVHNWVGAVSMVYRKVLHHGLAYPANNSLRRHRYI